MQRIEADVAVIGAGTAGLNARREAEIHGARTVLIESGPYGTTCARVGCMPSKLLIAAADVAHEIAGAERFGIEVEGPVRVNGKSVLERVRRERDRFVGFVVADTESLSEEIRLRGRARFLGPTTLAVDDHSRVEAGAVVIATGSSPVVPAFLAGVRDRVRANDSIFELDDLPASVAVLGTGVIGLELGQAFHRLGARTALFGRSGRWAALTDPELQTAAANILGRELDIRRATEFSAEPSSAGVRLHWKQDGEPYHEEFELVLAATGRRPELADLQLEAAGLELDRQGVPIHDPRTGRCGSSPVFIAGDVTHSRAVLHEAADEGRIAGYNATHLDDPRAHPRRSALSIVFTDPQIALVGTPYAELDPDRIGIGSVDYGDQGRARVMGKNAGLVRIYAEREDGRLVGAEMIGPRVEHTAHLLAWSVQQGLKVVDVLKLPFYHPVIEEGIRSALRDLARTLRFERPAPCARELDCGPGA